MVGSVEHEQFYNSGSDWDFVQIVCNVKKWYKRGSYISAHVFIKFIKRIVEKR